MKFNFLQGDFSSGELSPRAQGHADSDAYKAGLKYAANVAPTRAGSIASRAGLEFLLEGIDGNTGAPSNLPVQHIPIHDGPYGDFVLEVSPTGIRMVDKYGGALPFNFPPTSEFLQFTQQDGSFAYGDPRARAVYLRSNVATGARVYWLSKAVNAPNPPLLASFQFVNKPDFTNDNWILSGKISGDAVTARIQQATPANFQDIAIAPAADGTFSIAFRANVGGAEEDFAIRLASGVGTTATVLWGLKLTKNGVKEVMDTTAVIPAPVFLAAKVLPGQARVRAAAFWSHGDFWIAFAGGPDNAYAGFALRWTSGTPPVPRTAVWTFGTLPCTANSLAQIMGANAVAVFQDRLWYGINLPLPNAKRVIRASVVGFGFAWGYLAQAGSTGAPQSSGGKDILFQFTVEKESTTVVAGTGQVNYLFPSDNPKAQLIVKFTPTGAGNPTQIRKNTSDPFFAAPHEFDWVVPPDNGSFPFDQEKVPGGPVFFSVAVGKGLNFPGVVEISRVALATDPLDLNLATPNGKIAWLNVLRGLLLGTTRSEKQFSDGVALSIDPATGAAFELRDESNYGADPALAALDVNEHVLFAQRGRKVLRLAGINISSNGGLVSEDVGIAGEHLTKRRIRSMCFLKSPVQRVVFAFDDGTGAVMSLVNRGAGLSRQTIPAFTRLTIPACFGGIYSVASLDGDDDSELWIGTENGVTLRAGTFESDIVGKEVLLLNAAPAAPTHLPYDIDNPLPPVMDGWVRAPLVNAAGVQSASGLPASAVGQSAYALVNGQLLGPYVVAAGGKVVFPANLNLDKTWVDKTGARRAQEIYVGLLYPEHRWTSLPLEGGNPVGASQNLSSRKPQLHLRFVDSYMPLVNGKRVAERGQADPTDLLASRVTGDVRATEEGFQRAAVVDVVMDLPLRMEVSAIHGGVVMNSV